MELSGLGMELIHYLSRQFDLPLSDSFWRSISKLKGLSNMKCASYPKGIRLKTAVTANSKKLGMPPTQIEPGQRPI